MLYILITLASIVYSLNECYCNNNDGNIYLLEDEINQALKLCAEGEKRIKRSSNNNISDLTEDEETQNMDNTYQDAEDMSRHGDDNNVENYVQGGGHGKRLRRNDKLLDIGDDDKCLSQCVFANMQMVDSRGIPREAELWSKVQASVASQQTRAALRGQIRACFEELQSEAEDDDCSYSNKLERCLTLQLNERSMKSTSTTPSSSST